MARSNAFRVAATIACAIFVAAIPRAAVATPSKDGCTGVLQSPVTETILLDEPGTWCLDADLVIDGDTQITHLVTVQASDVVIDCRGHRMERQGDAEGYAYGVTSDPGVARTIVRNCHFRGFSHAIGVQSWDGGFLLEDNSVAATRPVYEDSAAPIGGWGRGIIRRNRVRDARDVGIEVYGDVDVIDNTIDGVLAPEGEPAFGITVNAFSSRLAIRGNTIRGLASTTPAVGIRVGVAQAMVEVRDNVLVGDGAAGTIAVACANGASTRLVGNVATGFETLAADGCHDSGDNDLSP